MEDKEYKEASKKEFYISVLTNVCNYFKNKFPSDRINGTIRVCKQLSSTDDKQKSELNQIKDFTKFSFTEYNINIHDYIVEIRIFHF